jgi:hypothetical protein
MKNTSLGLALCAARVAKSRSVSPNPTQTSVSEIPCGWSVRGKSHERVGNHGAKICNAKPARTQAADLMAKCPETRCCVCGRIKTPACSS